MVLNVTDTGNMTMRLINTYHAIPARGHDLHYLLTHDLDKMVLTLLIGDFNTHNPCWLMPYQMPSSWGQQLADWMDLQGLTCLNLQNHATWFHLSVLDCCSMTDLAFANKAAFLTRQLSNLQISNGLPPMMDHAALSILLYLLMNLALIPPPAPKGYSADPEHRDAWATAFTITFDTTVPWQPRGLPCLQQVEPKHSGHDALHRPPTAMLADLNDAIKHLDDAITDASRQTLKPC